MEPLSHLMQILEHDELFIEQARLRLYPYFEPPAQSEEFGPLFNKGSYFYDPRERKLDLLWAGSPRFSAKVESIGQYHRTQERWEWASEESPLHKFSSITPPLSLLSPHSVTLEESVAKNLAGWIALKAGYFSSYELSVTEEHSHFIAVKSIEPKLSARFCPVCFRSEHDNERMAAFSEGLALCEKCAELTVEIFNQNAEELNLALSDYLATPDESPKIRSGLIFPPCCMCGKREHVLLASHSSLCGRCALEAKKLFETKTTQPS